MPDEDMSRGEILMSNALEKLSRAATTATSSSSSSTYLSFQDSYISSEHCYQKPRAYYPAVEQRLVVETRQGSELEDSMRSTEELLEREQRFGGLLEMEKPKALGTTNKVRFESIEDSDVQTKTHENLAVTVVKWEKLIAQEVFLLTRNF